MKWLDRRFVPSHLPNFRCDKESETVDREIRVHSEHQSHIEKYQERRKVRAELCPELSFKENTLSLY